MTANKFYKTYLSLVVAILSLSFIACGNDDDEPNWGNIDTTKVAANAVFTDDEGDKVVAIEIGGGDLSYNEDGLPEYVCGYEIDYKNGVIYDDYEEYLFSMGSNGCIAALKIDYTDDEYYESESCTMKFTYNSSNQVTKITYSGTYTYYEDSKKYTDTSSGELSLTWQNNKMVKAKSTLKDYYADDKTTYNETTEYVVSYGGSNSLGQYTFAFREIFEDWYPVKNFTLVGLIGKAPSYLISSIAFTYEHWDTDSDRYTYNHTNNYSYTFNNNGTIETETESNMYYSESYSYRYSTFSSSRGFEMPTLSEWDEMATEVTPRTGMSRLAKRHKSRREAL